MLDPNAGRVRIVQDGNALKITITPERSLFGTLFVGFWLVGWAFGWVAAAGALFSGGAGGASIFLIGWLGAWTVGGLAALSFVLWNIAGREVITISPRAIEVDRRIPGWSRKTNCAMTEARNLKVNEDSAQSEAFGQRNSTPGLWAKRSDGVLRFEYGVHSIGFGHGLDPTEARKAAKIIHDAFPSLAPQ